MPSTEAQAAAPARRRGRQRAATGKPASKRSSPTLGDRVLALATGKTQQEIAAACTGARPNHVGVVLARHKRASRIEERDGKLYATQPEQRDAARALKSVGRDNTGTGAEENWPHRRSNRT